jgi:hypothetical protein
VGGGENNGMFGKNHSEETKKRIAENTRKHMKGTPKSLSQRKKMSLARSGAIHSPETIEKLKKPKTETHKEKLRKPKSEEAKQNMRVAARRRIQNNLGSLAVPNYNPRACKAIEELGNKLGYTFQHAMTPEGEFFINELFFWVDGYDVKNNVVVEYDEPHHEWTRHKRKDEVRQNEIINHLKCKFIRIKESRDGNIEVKHIN